MKDVFMLFVMKVILPKINLQILINRNARGICWMVFPLKPPSKYNLRNQQEFTVRPMKIIHCVLNSLAYLGAKIWELLRNN